MATTPTKPPGSAHIGGRPVLPVTRSPDPHYVVLASAERAVIARLISAVPTGGGGVDSVSRPQRTPLTDWTGSTPEGMTIQMVFDGFDAELDVEPAVRTLEILAGAFAGGIEPADLTVSCRAIRHSVEYATQNRWKISAPPDWSDIAPFEVERTADAVLTRQPVTVSLLLVTESNALNRVKAQAPAPSYDVVDAKHNDTFETIAHHKLGTVRLAGPLRRLNVDLGVPYFDGWRSNDRHIKAGTQVRLPTGALLKRWKRELKGTPS